MEAETLVQNEKAVLGRKLNLSGDARCNNHDQSRTFNYRGKSEVIVGSYSSSILYLYAVAKIQGNLFLKWGIAVHRRAGFKYLPSIRWLRFLHPGRRAFPKDRLLSWD
jgi:hypothetical protein